MKALLVSAFIFVSAIAQANFENFQSVVPGIDRSARPTSENIQWLAANNYKTILNLEAGHFSQKPGYVEEEEALATDLGLMFFHIPMHPMNGPTKEEIDAALAVIADPANHPILFHCKHGKDRTGIVAAAYRMKFQGWTFDQAVEEARAYGFAYFWFRNWLEVLHQYESQ